MTTTGSRPDLDAFFRERVASAIRQFRRLGIAPDETDDAVQELMIGLLLEEGPLPTDPEAAARVLALACLKTARELRRRKRLHARRVEKAARAVIAAEQLTRPSLYDIADLVRDLRALPADELAAVESCYLLGTKQQEYAMELGTSVADIEWRLKKARRSLREERLAVLFALGTDTRRDACAALRSIAWAPEPAPWLEGTSPGFGTPVDAVPAASKRPSLRDLLEVLAPRAIPKHATLVVVSVLACLVGGGLAFVIWLLTRGGPSAPALVAGVRWRVVVACAGAGGSPDVGHTGLTLAPLAPVPTTLALARRRARAAAPSTSSRAGQNKSNEVKLAGATVEDSSDVLPYVPNIAATGSVPQVGLAP